MLPSRRVELTPPSPHETVEYIPTLAMLRLPNPRVSCTSLLYEWLLLPLLLLLLLLLLRCLSLPLLRESARRAGSWAAASPIRQTSSRSSWRKS